MGRRVRTVRTVVPFEIRIKQHRPRATNNFTGRHEDMATQRLVLIFVALAIAAGLSGCAGIDYSKAGPGTKGIRYHRPTTYILVAPDYEKSAAKVTLIHGPDTSVAYAAKPYAWFATN